MEKRVSESQSKAYLWEFYEELNEIVYVADMDNYEMVYMNRRARELYGIESVDEIKGRKCHEVLSGSLTQCAICNCEKLKPGYFIEEVRYNPVIKKKLAVKETLIEEGGRKYRFELAVDLGAWE